MQKPLTMFHSLFAFSFTAISFCIIVPRIFFFFGFFFPLFLNVLCGIDKNYNRNKQMTKLRTEIGRKKKLWKQKPRWCRIACSCSPPLPTIRLSAVFFRALWLWKCARECDTMGFTAVLGTSTPDVRDIITNSTNTFRLALLTFSLSLRLYYIYNWALENWFFFSFFFIFSLYTFVFSLFVGSSSLFLSHSSSSYRNSFIFFVPTMRSLHHSSDQSKIKIKMKTKMLLLQFSRVHVVCVCVCVLHWYFHLYVPNWIHPCDVTKVLSLYTPSTTTLNK